MKSNDVVHKILGGKSKNKEWTELDDFRNELKFAESRTDDVKIVQPAVERKFGYTRQLKERKG